MGADEYWSMCLCMIFCNINFQDPGVMWIKRWIIAQLMSCIFLKVWWIFCMKCVEFRCALMHAAWMHDKTSGDGGDACRIFWGWLDAHGRTVLKVPKGSQIWMQPLEMHEAWNHESIFQIQRNAQIFGLTYGQLCVALSHCTSNNCIKFLFKDGLQQTVTQNVVCPEVLLDWCNCK